ncbi:MAG: adenosylcobinamide-GDP ribazoletransferase [Halapricum sp.]
MVLTAARRAVGVLNALRGGLGFLSRLPVGHDEKSWSAFRRQPAAFPLVGYMIGVLLAAPLFVLRPGTTAAAAFLVWVYLLTGVSHADAVTDLGDALAVHGDPEKRRSVMRDTAVGVGGVLALGLVLTTLALAAVQLAETALEGEIAAVFAIVVASEVGAKAAMATVVCLGEATHEGLGSALTAESGSRSLVPVLIAVIPVAGLTLVTPAAPVSTVAALLASVAVLRVARTTFGGVSGDVIGATNEVARVVALHAGVMLWTLS